MKSLPLAFRSVGFKGKAIAIFSFFGFCAGVIVAVTAYNVTKFKASDEDQVAAARP